MIQPETLQKGAIQLKKKKRTLYSVICCSTLLFNLFIASTHSITLSEPPALF